MSTRLILIRHGESEDNVAGRVAGWTDSKLTALGNEQARSMARHVAETYRPSALYASPLTRARQTADPLAARLGLAITFLDSLRELHFGAAEGLTVPEIQVRFPAEWQRGADEDNVEFSFPGGETRVRFYERVRQAFAGLVDHHPGETIAVISHGGVLSSFLADVVDGNPQRWRNFYKDNCALSELVAEDGRLRVVRWNVTEHLTFGDPAAT